MYDRCASVASDDFSIFDLVGESIIVRGADGRILAWNTASETLYGHQRRDTIGAPAEDILKTDYPAPLAEIEAQTFASGCWEGEVKRSSQDGQELWILARWSVRRAVNGEAVAIVETGRDITQSKRSEQALRYSEHRYHNLFQAMAASFWELDFSAVDKMLRDLRKSGVEEFPKYFEENPGFVRDMMCATRVIDVNDQSIKLFGRGNKDELLGSVEPFWPEESTHIFAQGILAGAARKPHYTAECKMRRIDGSTFDALFTAAFPPETMGKGALLIGVIDITERKQTFAKLAASERRYRDLFHYMPIALTQVDASRLIPMYKELRAQGVTDLKAYIDEHPEFLDQAMEALHVEEVNEHNCRMFGAETPADMYGPITRYFTAARSTIRRSIEARYAGQDFFQEEMKATRLDGSTIDVLFATARPGAIADKSLVGFIDISARKSAEERLRRVQDDFAHAARVSMLGELTASIAHEVNQPLAAIAANGEAGLRWLGRAAPNVEEVRELTKRIVADARRAGEIISRIRAMASRHTPEQVALQLDDVVREVLLFLRHEVQARGVTILHRPAQGAPPILADRTQIQQVIVNLAVNGMQAMAQSRCQDPRMIMSTQIEDGLTIKFGIEDSGPGIGDEGLSRLFDSFFTTKDGGMGMGLPICRSIIEAHGGRIAGDNSSTIGGARFFFTLPVAQ
jgi:PAS domain S-box-containing protein